MKRENTERKEFVCVHTGNSQQRFFEEEKRHKIEISSIYSPAMPSVCQREATPTLVGVTFLMLCHHQGGLNNTSPAQTKQKQEM